MAEIIEFKPTEVGEGYRFDPDEVLEAAKGNGFTIISIVGLLEDGSFWVSGSANAGETLLLLERAKHQIVFGEQPE